MLRIVYSVLAFISLIFFAIAGALALQVEKMGIIDFLAVGLSAMCIAVFLRGFDSVKTEATQDNGTHNS